jgi:hypothetical protein
MARRRAKPKSPTSGPKAAKKGKAEKAAKPAKPGKAAKPAKPAKAARRRRVRSSGGGGGMDTGTMAAIGGGAAVLMIIIVALAGNRGQDGNVSRKPRVIHEVRHVGPDGNPISQTERDAIALANRLKKELAEQKKLAKANPGTPKPATPRDQGEPRGEKPKNIAEGDSPPIASRAGAPKPSWMVRDDGGSVTEGGGTTTPSEPAAEPADEGTGEEPAATEVAAAPAKEPEPEAPKPEEPAKEPAEEPKKEDPAGREEEWVWP